MIGVMTLILIFAAVLIFLFAAAIAIILYLNWTNLMILLHPDRYNECQIIQLDDSISREIVKKNEDLKYTFNGNEYNMFYSERQQQQESNEHDRKKSTVFRSGAIASFTFLEGQEDPLDFRDLKKNFSLDSKIKREHSKTDLAKLVSSVHSQDSIFSSEIVKYVLIAVVVIIIIILLFRSNTVTLSPETLKALKG